MVIGKASISLNVSGAISSLIEGISSAANRIYTIFRDALSNLTAYLSDGYRVISRMNHTLQYTAKDSEPSPPADYDTGERTVDPNDISAPVIMRGEGNELGMNSTPPFQQSQDIKSTNIDGLDQKLKPERSFIEFFKEVPLYEVAFYAKWLFSNELEQSTTLDWLRSQSVYGDTFVGTGCFFTLNAFSIRPEQVDHLVVIDISLGVADFWNHIKEIALRSSNCEEAIQKVIDKFQIDRPRCLQDRSWLSTDVQFLKVKKLFQENRFVFIRADFTDIRILEKVGKGLKNASRTIDTVYESNIGSCSFTTTCGRRFNGSYGLSSIVQNFLVKIASQSIEETRFLEIFADGGSMSAVAQQRYIRVLK